MRSSSSVQRAGDGQLAGAAARLVAARRRGAAAASGRPRRNAARLPLLPRPASRPCRPRRAPRPWRPRPCRRARRPRGATLRPCGALGLASAERCLRFLDRRASWRLLPRRVDATSSSACASASSAARASSSRRRLRFGETGAVARPRHRPWRRPARARSRLARSSAVSARGGIETTRRAARRCRRRERGAGCGARAVAGRRPRPSRGSGVRPGRSSALRAHLDRDGLRPAVREALLDLTGLDSAGSAPSVPLRKVSEARFCSWSTSLMRLVPHLAATHQMRCRFERGRRAKPGEPLQFRRAASTTARARPRQRTRSRPNTPPSSSASSTRPTPRRRVAPPACAAARLGAVAGE